MSVYGAVLQGLQRFEQPWLQHKAQTSSFWATTVCNLQLVRTQRSWLYEPDAALQNIHYGGKKSSLGVLEKFQIGSSVEWNIRSHTHGLK